MRAHDAWGTDVDAAMRRHPAGSGAAEDDRWTSRHQVELHRVLTADARPTLPPNWQAWADAEPEVSALHKVAVWVLLDTAAVLVLLVVGRIMWQGISTVGGL